MRAALEDLGISISNSDIDAITWKKAFRHAYMPLIQVRDVTRSTNKLCDEGRIEAIENLKRKVRSVKINSLYNVFSVILCLASSMSSRNGRDLPLVNK